MYLWAIARDDDLGGRCSSEQHGERYLGEVARYVEEGIDQHERHWREPGWNIGKLVVCNRIEVFECGEPALRLATSTSCSVALGNGVARVAAGRSDTCFEFKSLRFRQVDLVQESSAVSYTHLTLPTKA